MDSPSTINLATRLLVEGPNIRKKFSEAKHVALTTNVRIHGVLENLIVRPHWCVGVTSRAEIEKLAERGDLQASPFQIIGGARRFRAAIAADIPAVPCTVRHFTDAEAFDIQLIENLQREDLTPIEEAEGYAAALELRIDGKAVHTVETLAERINKDADHIYRMLKLVGLPKDLREAVEAGHLPIRQASLIGRIPDETARIDFGRQVLNGHGTNLPLTVREAEELRARSFMRELKGAPFDQENGGLCLSTAAGQPDHGRWSGACSDCPYRSGNIAGFEGKRSDICTRPACFQIKADAAYTIACRQATEEGKKVMAPAESARHFDPLGELTFATTLARLGEKPRSDQLKAEVKRVPTWSALRGTAIESGMEVPIYVARNPKTGMVEELVDTAPLIAAAKKIGEPIFRGGKEDEPLFPPKREGEDDDDAFRRGQAEANQRQQEAVRKDAVAIKAKRAQALLVFEALLDRLTEDCSGMDRCFEPFVPFFVDAAGKPGLRLVIELFELKPTGGEFAETDCVTKWLRSLPGANRSAACLMLLISSDVSVDGHDIPVVRALAKAFGVDVAALLRADKAADKPPAPPKPKKKRLAKGAKATKAGKVESRESRAESKKKGRKGGAK